MMLERSYLSLSQARPELRIVLLLACWLISLFNAALADQSLLQRGQWEGEYLPANLGDGIDATFCIEACNSDRGSGTTVSNWQVTMNLDLPPPGNEPVEFEIQETADALQSFKFKLLGVVRECAFQGTNEDELSFECRFVDNQSNNTEALLMRRSDPQPDDVCLPQATAVTE